MNRPREELFSCSTLASDQHRRWSWRYTRHQTQDLYDPGADPNDVVVQASLGPQPHGLRFQKFDMCGVLKRKRRNRAYCAQPMKMPLVENGAARLQSQQSHSAPAIEY